MLLEMDKASIKDLEENLTYARRRKHEELRAFGGPVKHAVGVIVTAILEAQHVFWCCRGRNRRSRGKKNKKIKHVSMIDF